MIFPKVVLLLVLLTLSLSLSLVCLKRESGCVRFISEQYDERPDNILRFGFHASRSWRKSLPDSMLSDFLEIVHYVVYMRNARLRILMHVLRSTDRNAKRGEATVAETLPESRNNTAGDFIDTAVINLRPLNSHRGSVVILVSLFPRFALWHLAPFLLAPIRCKRFEKRKRKNWSKSHSHKKSNELETYWKIISRLVIGIQW